MIDKLKNIILEVVNQILQENNIQKELRVEDIKIEKTQNDIFGDFTSNIVMVLKKEFDLKEELMARLNQNAYILENISKLEYKEPGFINFFIKSEFLIENLKSFVEFDSTMVFKDKVSSFLIEHTSPNTNKPLHIGHLRNSVFAMAVVRILKALNHKVTVDCLFNDRGIHICKAMFGYLKEGRLEIPIKEVLEVWNQNEWPKPGELENPDDFVGRYYILGVECEKTEQYKAEMIWLLNEWENKNEKVLMVWKYLNDLFYSSFYNTFKRINSYADHFWYESEFFQKAKDLAQVGLEKGVFLKLEDGALLTQLQDYKLTDDIVQRSDGTAMYFTQDLYLTKMKVEKFPADLYLWVVGPEQKLHMQQVYAVCDQMGIGNISKFKHLSYGAVCQKDGGKMSSRTGTVITINELIKELKDTVKSKKDNEYKSLATFSVEEQDNMAEIVGIGAIKYAILRLEKEQDLHFSFEEILDLKGNGSPYIQYTYARCKSIIEKAGEVSKEIDNTNITEEELTLLRKLIHFKDVIEKAGDNFAPHFVANYIYELARDFSNFYEKNRILDAEVNKGLKVDLTLAAANVLKFGLALLGVDVLERL
jgi:arginyl-tRNA synthetase